MKKLAWTLVVTLAVATPVYSQIAPPADSMAGRIREIQNTATNLWNEYSGPAIDYGIAQLPAGSQIQGTRQFLEEWERLHQSDASYEPNMDGAPTIPSSCLEKADSGDPSAAACQECFGAAYEKLNFARMQLERVRALYSATKASTDRSISTGDSLAPSTGIAAIEWNRQKQGIIAEMDNFKNTCRQKYTDLLGTLRTGLNMVADCEQRIFNEANWYDRFGFIYYTYMQDRYQITD